MSKFKISMKITGFELQIEGNREDVPLMTQAVGQQIAGLLAPATDVIEGEVVETKISQPLPPKTLDTQKRRSSTRRRTTQKPSSEVEGGAQLALDWRHDPSKYGFPLQKWTTADKSLWLLYVVSEELNIKEMASNVIEATFNKHFRQAGTIRPFNVTRDLRNAQTKQPVVVSADTSKDPALWFLTTAGVDHAKDLVTKAIGDSGK